MSPFPPCFLNRDARSLSLRSLASAISERRQFFVACEDCAAHLALSLHRRLDNRVSSSSALSEARLIFLLYLSIVQCSQDVAILCACFVELELRYVQRPLYIYIYIPIYIYEKSLPDVRLGWLAPARQLRIALCARID